MMKIKIVLVYFAMIVTGSAFAASGLSLEDVSFSGKCGTTTVKGTASDGIGTYFRPGNFVATNRGKTLFNAEEGSLAIPVEHLAVSCIETNGVPKLVIAVDCLAHAKVCARSSYYIFNAVTGETLAPKDMKSEKALCNSKCADRILGSNDLLTSEEKARYQ